MVHRALSIPLDAQDFHNEIQLIKQIAQKNHIQFDVDKSIKRKKYSLFKNNTSHLSEFRPPDRKWIRLPFAGNVSYKLERIIQKSGYEAAFYTLNSMRSLLQLKDPIPFWERSGSGVISKMPKSIFAIFQEKVKTLEKSLYCMNATGAWLIWELQPFSLDVL